ncbi:MAG TPA: phosphotransferase [Ignavibacteria bacterium]|nr:phosphotransferase [Ignavibacteria bacterium]
MEISPLELKTHYSNLLELHLKWRGNKIDKYEQLLSHGSDRLIVRLYADDGTTSIGIVNRHTEENRAFISFGDHFIALGLNVPRIHIVSAAEDSYILDDLGNDTLLSCVLNADEFNTEVIALYKKVIDELPKFQVTANTGLDYSLCYQYGEFGRDNIEYDLDYFKQRFLKNFHKGTIDEVRLDSDLSYIREKILEYPREYFLYRDFQSRNIMIKNGEPFFIDFQSGRKGALLYDIASLMYDAKADIPQQVREELLEYYLEVILQYVKADTDKMRSYFWYFALIRIMQAMGAYGFLGIVKGKKRFLESIPYALRNINFILNERIPGGELPYLRQIFGELLNANNTYNDKT